MLWALAHGEPIVATLPYPNGNSHLSSVLSLSLFHPLPPFPLFFTSLVWEFGRTVSATVQALGNSEVILAGLLRLRFCSIAASHSLALFCLSLRSSAWYVV